MKQNYQRKKINKPDRTRGRGEGETPRTKHQAVQNGDRLTASGGGWRKTNGRRDRRGGDAWVRKTNGERERERYETDWDRDKKYLGFIKRQRYKVFFFFLNLIPKRRRFGTDIKTNIRLKRRLISFSPSLPLWDSPSSNSEQAYAWEFLIILM